MVFNRFSEIAAKLPRETGVVVQETLFSIESRAKILCPVDTGALRASIHSEMETPTSGTVSTNIEYAIFPEYGTVHQAAQPYMTPAGEQARSGFIQAMSNLEALLD